MLTEMLREAVAANPRKAAIVQGGRRVRYDELESLAARSAGSLRQLGVQAGDCVAVVLPNCPEFVATLFACARLRAVMLPLNPEYTREELQRLMAQAEAKFVIADSSRAGLFDGADVTVVEFGRLLQHPAVPAPAEHYAGRALFMATTGSTETAKLLCCTQKHLFYEAHNF